MKPYTDPPEDSVVVGVSVFFHKYKYKYCRATGIVINDWKRMAARGKQKKSSWARKLLIVCIVGLVVGVALIADLLSSSSSSSSYLYTNSPPPLLLNYSSNPQLKVSYPFIF